jgi:hypothetical protein
MKRFFSVLLAALLTANMSFAVGANAAVAKDSRDFNLAA